MTWSDSAARHEWMPSFRSSICFDTLTADNDKLTAANAAKDAEIEALKKSWQSCSRMHNTGLALVRNVHRWAHHLEKGACIEAPFSM